MVVVVLDDDYLWDDDDDDVESACATLTHTHGSKVFRPNANFKE